jgi:hypothetical protein
MRRFAPMVVAGLVVVVVGGSAWPQGNIDAGKTPAQMFSDTCATCHRRPQDLKSRASASFLRQHYMSGAQEAAAMASYLAGVPSAPKGAKDAKGKALTQPQTQPQTPQQAQDAKAKTQLTATAAKGKRPSELGRVSSPESHPEATSEPVQAAEAPPAPVLEPFEE